MLPHPFRVCKVPEVLARVCLLQYIAIESTMKFDGHFGAQPKRALTGSFGGSSSLAYSCIGSGRLGTTAMEEVFAPEEEPPVLPRTLELERDHSFEVVFRQMQAGPQRGAWHE